MTFPITTDALLLAQFASGYCGEKTLRGLDLGCGSGIVALETAVRCGNVSFLGVEISREAAELARLSAEEYGLSDRRVTIVNADLRAHREIYRAGSFGFAVANPPYFARGRGRSSPETAKSVAREECEASFRDFCDAAAYGVKTGGAFLFVLRAERLAEAFRDLAATGFEPKRLQFAQKDASSAPKLALVDARLGGKPPLTVLPPIYTEVK